MLKEDLPPIWEDIKNISFSLDGQGEWEVIHPVSNNTYDYSLTKEGLNYVLELVPKHTHEYGFIFPNCN